MIDLSEQNLFVRIDDISQLNAGDKVIITNHFSGTLDHFGGNPIYLCARDYDGRSAMGDKYFITNSLSNYQILNVDKVGEYFTFQFTYVYSYYWDKVVCLNKYLAYRQSDGHWDDSKGLVYLLGDLYFTDNKNSEFAQWKFTPNMHGNGFFNMQRSGEEYGTFITYMSGTTRDRFWYGGVEQQYDSDYGVRLYKYVNLNDYQYVFNSYNISEPNRTTFYQGEDIDLTGLEFNLYLFDEDYVIGETTDFTNDSLYIVHSKYEDEKNLYSSVSVEGSGNSTRAVFTYLGLSYRVFISIIQESTETTQYQLMDYSLFDYRGTYYLGTISSEHPYGEDGEDESKYTVFALTGTSGTNMGGIFGDLSIDISSQIIDVPTSGSQKISTSKFEVRRVVVDNVSNTYLCNPLYDKYLSYDGNNALCYVEESDLSNKEIFSINDNKPVLNGNMYIIFNDSSFAVSTDATNATSMFKLMPKSEFYTELNGFKTTFFEKIQCLSEGNTNFTGQDWADTKTAFNAISVDVQGYLANLTYVHNGEESGSAGDMVDRYDYILSKYPESYDDFMNRKDANTYRNYFDNVSSMNMPLEEVTNLNLVIVILSLITVSSLTFFGLFIKNKKHVNHHK